MTYRPVLGWAYTKWICPFPLPTNTFNTNLNKAALGCCKPSTPWLAKRPIWVLKFASAWKTLSRADADFLVQIATAAQQAGATRIRFADTVGIMEPFGVFAAIKQLRTATDLDIEMHAHDDLGLATANTLAAALAGATHVNTTVNGLGERAGNAALEEVVVGCSNYTVLIQGFRWRSFRLCRP